MASQAQARMERDQQVKGFYEAIKRWFRESMFYKSYARTKAFIEALAGKSKTTTDTATKGAKFVVRQVQKAQEKDREATEALKKLKQQKQPTMRKVQGTRAEKTKENDKSRVYVKDNFTNRVVAASKAQNKQKKPHMRQKSKAKHSGIDASNINKSNLDQSNLSR